MSSAQNIIISGGFDDIRSKDLRFLDQASRLGALTVLLWNDQAIEKFTGKPPQFPLAERNYVLNAIRYVARVVPIDNGNATPDLDSLPEIPGLRPDVWVDIEASANAKRKKFCRNKDVLYRVFKDEDVAGFPEPSSGAGILPASSKSGEHGSADLPAGQVVQPNVPTHKKVVATGCFDWIHSGHVRFFEEVSAYGELYIIVGHDQNIRLLKGKGHPFFPQEERRYAVSSIKYVKQALISTGDGWLDADPEIRRLKPDIYVVNEDGDKGGKREYCRKLGIEYLVLKRAPARGLPKRSSTDLRGF
ncbi:MAG TPA: adenylyltransferase/cytidyltransferase family protein [Verrucomicrobiae bacterium]|nr:adenylyltransferase/cytidyltransferase family protein [Verrucomicrobiae bacterium]